MSLWTRIQSGCAALSLNCREATRAQSDALQGPLSPARRIGLSLHLLLCKWCRRYGRQIRFLHEAAREHGEELAEASPQALSNAARTRIKQRLRDQK
jgi:hypothetical protein